MARIAEVDIPRNKHVIVSLTYVYGIGNAAAKRILADTGISGDVRIRKLTNEQADAIRAEVDKLKVEGDLRRGVNLNVRRLIKIGSCRGIRHRRGLPIHRQNTENSARTRKSPARAITGKEE